MWGEDNDRGDRRRGVASGRGNAGSFVPRWFWLVVAAILLLVAIRFLNVPFFLLFFLFIFGRGHMQSWFQGKSGSSSVQRAEPGPIPTDEPTIRWGEAAASGHQARVRDAVADTELADVLATGREQAARMRRTLGAINDRESRLRVTNLVDDADRILTSLRDRGDTVLAHTFNDRYLAPATTILTRYSRLVSRDLTTARPVLDRVETHDLPLLQRRYDEFYEQVHRGDLIDLQVASEMLAFELDEPVNGTPSLSATEAAGPREDTVQWSGAHTTGRQP